MFRDDRATRKKVLVRLCVTVTAEWSRWKVRRWLIDVHVAGDGLGLVESLSTPQASGLELDVLPPR
jgi:hypothetical protein